MCAYVHVNMQLQLLLATKVSPAQLTVRRSEVLQQQQALN